MAFTLEIELLTQRYRATQFNDRRKAEWPPHPARLYFALVDTWVEAGEDPEERCVLEWLEQLPPPHVRASTDPSLRRIQDHFVPVNDVFVVGQAQQSSRYEKITSALNKPSSARSRVDERKTLKLIADARDVRTMTIDVGNTSTDTATAQLPEHRPKQARTFPVVRPDSPIFSFSWDDQCLPVDLEAPAERLLDRVHRLGHSSSLICARISSDPSALPAWIPDEAGDTDLRWIAPGHLNVLRDEFERHRGVSPRALPAKSVRYGQHLPGTPIHRPLSNLAGRMIVFEIVAPRNHPVQSVPMLTDLFRRALMSHGENPLPEVLSGHTSSGSATTNPHIAFVGLPFVGHQHADGTIMGLAVVLPTESPLEVPLARAMKKFEDAGARLDGNGLRVVLRRLHPAGLEGAPASIKPQRWSKPSTVWRTVTPIALPRHPGNLSRGSLERRERAWREAEQIVRLACNHINLPEPSDVTLQLDPFFAGSRHIAAFPEFRQGSQRRMLVHAELEFPVAVAGPVIIGSGRFRGLGICLPVRHRDGQHD